jgi:GxxExxY protein
MEVHNNLGAGFLEIVYKDALEFEFRRDGIPYEREREYVVNYKGSILPHNVVNYKGSILPHNIMLISWFLIRSFLRSRARMALQTKTSLRA